MKNNITTRGNPYRVYRDGMSDQATIIRACDPKGALRRFFQSSFQKPELKPYRGRDPATAKYWIVKTYFYSMEIDTGLYVVSYTKDKRAQKYKINSLFF